MPYYEIEYTLENLMQDSKKQQEQQEDQQQQSTGSDSMKQAKSVLSSQQATVNKSINTPKMPKMSAPNIPKPGRMKL